MNENQRKSIKLWRDHAERVTMGLCETPGAADLPGWALCHMATLAAELAACCTMVEIVADGHTRVNRCRTCELWMDHCVCQLTLQQAYGQDVACEHWRHR